MGCNYAVPFLSATIMPILVGAAVAKFMGFPVDWSLLGLTLLGGSLLHIGTNTSNDYFDHLSGTDSINYNYSNKGLNGGSRGIQMGLITPVGVRNLTIIVFTLSVVVGIPLIQKAGIQVLWLGLIGFLSGLFYTAPPFRFSSRKGMGELLIGLNFGPLMVAGSALVQTGKLLPEAFLAGIPLGFLIAAVVYINEFPDHDSDKKTGKNTLIVVFGPEKAGLCGSSIRRFLKHSTISIKWNTAIFSHDSFTSLIFWCHLFRHFTNITIVDYLNQQIGVLLLCIALREYCYL